MYKAYVFDVDGTLLDTAPCILNSIKKAFQKAEVDISNIAFTEDLIGPKIPQIIDMLGIKISTQKKEQIIKNFRNIYDNNPSENTKIYPEAQQILNQFAGNKMFIATNKPYKPTKKLLDNFNLNIFQKVMCPDIEEGKLLAKADMIRELIEIYQLNPRGTLFIGDTQGDYEAAKQSQCAFGFASWGYAKNKEDLKKVADVIFS